MANNGNLAFLPYGRMVGLSYSNSPQAQAVPLSHPLHSERYRHIQERIMIKVQVNHPEKTALPPRDWCSFIVFIKLNNSCLLLMYLGCFFLFFKIIFKFKYMLIIFYPLPKFSMILSPSLLPYLLNFQFFLKKQTKHNFATKPPKPR